MKRQTRRGLATWLTGSQTPVFVLDERRVVLVFNRGCEELTQWDAAEVIGKTCEFRSEANSQLVDSITAALCPPAEVIQGQAARRRTLIHRRHGDALEQDVHFFPLLDSSQGSKRHILGILTPCGAPAPASDALHFDVARHVAGLHDTYRLDRLIALSEPMVRVAAQLDIARQTLGTVHVIGEPGTGKEHILRLVHYASPLKARRFVPLRCATSSHFELSRTLKRLLDADQNSDVGTVYLDQIDRIPGDLQPLVLAQLAVPGIRWVSSSLQGLEGLSDEAFLPALRSRLTCLTISLPPLRARGSDLLLLAQQILEESNKAEGVQREGFSAAVLRLFQQYTWPGNVDELSAVIQHACQQCPSTTIDVEHLPFELSAGRAAQAVRPPRSFRSLEEELEDYERRQITSALEAARGNKSLAAESLGMPRARLYRRMAALGLLEEGAPGEDDPAATPAGE